MQNKPFLLGATLESAEEGPKTFGSDEWLEVEIHGAGVGLRVELRVEGEAVVLRVVGYQPGRPSADHEITTQTIPIPSKGNRPEASGSEVRKAYE